MPTEERPAERVIDDSTNDRALQSAVEIDIDKRAADLARLVIREGKSFRQSALEVGYSQSIADNGLARLMGYSQRVTAAVQAEYRKLETNISALKPMAITRLFREIADQESSLGIKAIELAGKFKECDWFVRSAEHATGIFLTVQDTPPSSETTTDLEKYEE